MSKNIRNRLRSSAERAYNRLARKQILDGISLPELAAIAVLGAALDQIALTEKHARIFKALAKAIWSNSPPDPLSCCNIYTRHDEDE